MTTIEIHLNLEGLTEQGSARFIEEYVAGVPRKLPRGLFYLRPDAYQEIGEPTQLTVVVRRAEGLGVLRAAS